MSRLERAFSIAREIAHAGIAVVGSLSASAAILATSLDACGVHVTDLQVLQELGIAGGVLTVLSKAIDSVNDAIVNRGRAPETGTPS